MILLRIISKNKKKKSRLWAEVHLGFIACERWMENVKVGKVPRDIEESLKRKCGRLQTFLTLEALEKLSDASKDYQKMIEEAKLEKDAKHPMLYYEKGKELMGKNLWYDAKQEFLTYSKFMELEESQREEFEKSLLQYKSIEEVDKRRKEKEKTFKCRKPEEDNCFCYLSYCEEQMKLQGVEEDNQSILSQRPTCSVVPDERKNPYEKRYREWRAKHKPSKAAIDSQRGTLNPTPKVTGGKSPNQKTNN